VLGEDDPILKEKLKITMIELLDEKERMKTELNNEKIPKEKV